MSVATDILVKIDVDSSTNITYKETTTWYDGSIMNDAKCDGVIYKKRDGKYYRKTNAVEDLFKVDNVATLRNYNGYSEGHTILLMGYYGSGDKKPVKYTFTVQNLGSLVDDGGSVIKTDKGAWIAEFNGVINALDFGLKADYDPISNTGTDNSRSE